MAGHIVADIEITDPDEYQKYAQQTGATFERYGGKSWCAVVNLRQ
jgi:uncharacterized protein (DUF1330 family)